MRNLKRKYFEVWADEEAQNLILKWILIFALILIVFETACLCVLALKKPIIFAVGEGETKSLTFMPPKAEILRSELERTLKIYIDAHYNWDYGSIEKSNLVASHYVSEKFQKAFLSANSDQVKLAKEKKVTQSVYLSRPVEVDTEKLTAKIMLDRIFSVEGIKATAPLTIQVNFEYGPRTDANPEGVYIIDEKLVAPDDSNKK